MTLFKKYLALIILWVFIYAPLMLLFKINKQLW